MNVFVYAYSVCFFGLNRCRNFIANGFSRQGFFQSYNDISNSLNESQWFASFRRVKCFSSAVFQCEVNQHYFVLCNCHVNLFMPRK